jgi:L-threonylcarbamoyladenylate synthase
MVDISIGTAATLKGAATSLRAGNLVAFPTETVYGLGADATNEQAVARLYSVKARPVDHPLIVHISSLANLDKWARDVPEYAIKLAHSFWPGPLTLILPRTNLAKNFVTGGQDNVALRVPSHSFALSLISEFEAQGGIGVAAPSANRYGKVSPTTAEAVAEELSSYLSPTDLILDGGPCQVGVESTIINCTQAVPEILRPGAVTINLINDHTGIEPVICSNYSNQNKIKAPGLMQSHYAPKATVFLSIKAQPGDGFIALSNIDTPNGAVRLASPRTNLEYARVLYQALRLADNQQLSKVYVVPPIGDDIAIAIRDRLLRCASLIF